MTTRARSVAYLLGLAAVFGVALGVGTVVGPVGPASAGSGHGGGGHADHPPTSGASAEQPGGLLVSDRGYALRLDAGTARAGTQRPVAFRVLGPDGAPVTAYERRHDQDLHPIAVRRDLTGFQHVHPRLAPDGTWRTALDLRAGDWRVFADSAPTALGEPLTLGADLAVAGDYDPEPLPAPSATARVDGYAVTLDGRVRAGTESELTLSVSRDGAPVTDLQPYLAAYGHLVVLRAGDLAYLHVHPNGAPGDGSTAAGPAIAFRVTPPSAGDYRLFLDFRHRGVVRTAELTVRVADR